MIVAQEKALCEAARTLRTRQVAGALSRSKIYRDYQQAFTKATGLALTLHAPGDLDSTRAMVEGGFAVLRVDGEDESIVRGVFRLAEEAGGKSAA